MQSIIKVLVLLTLAVLVLSIGGFGQQAVKNPDTLTILSYGQPTTLDPAVSYTVRGWIILRNVYDRLVQYKGTSTTEFAPMLAESWKSSKDGKVWTFHLRKGVKFHDGSLVTASAVKYSFDRVLKMNQGPAWMLSQCMDLNSTQVIDDYTVQITLTKPYAAFLSIMAVITASVVNPQIVEAHGGVQEGQENKWMTMNEAGSGPFFLKEWAPNEKVVLDRFNDYFMGPAKLARVIVSIVPEVGTRIMYLKKGDADIVYQFPKTNIPDILGSEGVVIKRSSSFHLTFVVINTKTGVLADKSLRQALAYTMPYDTVIKYIEQGYARRSYGPIPAGMFGYYKVEPAYTYDLDKASELLNAAGYALDPNTNMRIDPHTGHTVTVELCVSQASEDSKQIAVMWQNELRKVGIDLKIRMGTFAVLHDLMRRGGTNMLIAGWYPDYADPDDYTDPLVGPSHFWKAYSNKEVNTLIDKGKWEANRDARFELYKKIQEIVKEDVPYIWLAQEDEVTVMRSWVQGYYFHPVDPINFYVIYKAYK